MAAAPTLPEAPGSRGLRSPAFTRILVAQATFGFGWCLYLVQPKFLTTELGVGPREVGTVTSMSGIASIATIAVLVSIIDRPGGRRRAFLWGTVILGLASFGYLFVERFGPAVYLLQAGIAVAYGLTFNSALALVTDVAPPERLGQGFGLQTAANLSMNAVSTVIAEGVARRFGWRAVFGLGVVAAAAAFTAGLGLPRSGGSASGETRPSVPPPYRSVWPILAASACMGSAFIALFAFHQPYAIGLGVKDVSAFFVGFTAAALFMRLGFGTLGDRFGRRRVSASALALYSLVPVSLLWFEPSLLWLYGAGLGIAHGVAYPTLIAFATERAPQPTRGRIIAVYSGCFSVGTSAGAFAWGFIAEHHGYARVFLVAGVGVAAAAALLLARTKET